MQPSKSRPIVVAFRWNLIAGWIVLGVLTVIPLVLWASVVPLGVRFSDLSSTIKSIGLLTGIIGLLFYAYNLVLATRLRFLESLFGGLNRVYIAHHILGGLALIFLAFHPVALAIKEASISIKNVANLLLPSAPTWPVDRNTSVTFGIIAFWGMVVLLIITFYVKLPYKLWLLTHKFLGVAFFFAGLHVLFIGSDINRSITLKVYLLSVTALGLAAFIYRTLLGRILVRKYLYTVDDVKQVGGNVTQLLLSPLAMPMSYQPGQFVFIRFMSKSGHSSIKNEWHPFSISSSPSEKYIRLSVKALGDFTKELSTITPDFTAEIEGAYGKFSYKNYSAEKMIWIAGGIGVSPFLSMARSLPLENPPEIDFYYSVKTESELIDIETLKMITEKLPNKFRLFTYVGDIEKGYLNADYIEQHSGTLYNKEIFVCGPPPLMKSMRKQLKDKGVPSAFIHSEEFAMS